MIFKGLKISVMGEKIEIFYEDYQSLFNHSDNQYDLHLIESHPINDYINYLIYSMTDYGLQPNLFDLHSRNVYGDILVIEVNEREEFRDLDISRFLDYYEMSDNLDDYLIEDEESFSAGSYDYNDGWLVRDLI